MKKILKITGLILLTIIVVLAVFAWIKSEPLPAGKSGVEADILAKKMLTALNYETYKNTRFLEWQFRANANQYKWDRQLGICMVKWKDYEVSLNLANSPKSKVVKNGQPLPSEENQELIEKALDMFYNDSFWLVAPYKVFDKGTTRSIVDLEDGTEGLLVTYTTGGSTPGDSYLWQLNPNGFPNSFKMWVNVIPIGGLEASWDDWLVAESGAFLPKTHEFGPITFSMGELRGY